MLDLVGNHIVGFPMRQLIFKKNPHAITDNNLSSETMQTILYLAERVNLVETGSSQTDYNNYFSFEKFSCKI